MSLRILYVLPYVPSPIRVRPYQIVRHLARQGHRVSIAALDDGLATEAVRAELTGLCEAVHIVPHPRLQAALSCLAALPTRTPLWAAYCRSPRMERLLRRLTAEAADYDVAHVEHLRAASFAPHLDRLPKLLDAVDCITELRRQVMEQAERGADRLLSWEEWVKLRTFEPRTYRAFRRIVLTTPENASALISLDPFHLPPVEVVSNGVDLEYFRPALDAAPEGDCLIFSGKMSYVANEDAARFLLRDILPRLRRLRPNAQLILAGSGPSAALRRMARRAGNVTVTGFLDDLRPSLRRAVVAVCPIRIGVGIQNKVLEAMAMGLPVVASPLGARPFAEAERVGALCIARTADEFAGQCAAWLADPMAAQRAGRAGRRYVEESHRWEDVASRFVELYYLMRRE
jgi:glycosyltransferase involved in cell wall biosynthesis